ncbi:hypothetical protein [Pseudomonas sp. BIGb0164]|uniref:DUF4760 domain-containing protein n=1 Tax=Pseudomonas sp. BIGb0164 TaxID=2940605 RepID=UPI0021685194|nr:hypothetical protein [Pseudomonas sp. BIGb0164]MCS4250042.1 hypothetical protein [Pseudomonas sp. BIGb0164]
METNDYNLLASVIQVFLAVLALVSVVLVLRQITILTSQLKATQLASEAQSIISIVEFLQTNEAREARETVRAKLSELHHDAWDEQQNRHAALACANYDVVAALLRVDLIKNKHVIIENWAPSIIHCHRVLSPFIEKKRIIAGGDRKYWSNFDWLRDQCARS